MRFLGKTGIQVSELCMGTGTFGGRGVLEITGCLSQREANDAVSIAIDAGINFFDSAEIYSNGLAEEILGKALGARRRNVIVTTKVRHDLIQPGLNDGGLSRYHIIKACEASLRRLDTDYIDVYQFGGFDPNTPLEESLRAMDDLVHQGKVRYIGCSNFTGWQFMKALAISDKNGGHRFVMIEALYSLLARGIEFELVPLSLDQGFGIVGWSPLHGGFLSGKYRRGQPSPKGARLTAPEAKRSQIILPFDEKKGFDIVEELARIAKAHNATASQAALNYLLRKPATTSLIIGFRTPEQLADNLKTTHWEMSQEEVARLDKLSEPARPYPYWMFTGPQLSP